MTQSVQFNGHLTRLGTRTDGSLGISIETGELVADDMLVMFSFRNIPCLITLKPNDANASPPREVKGELSKKTDSERIRAVLFVWWNQLGSPGEFQAFYHAECEKFIMGIKKHLKPV